MMSNLSLPAQFSAAAACDAGKLSGREKQDVKMLVVFFLWPNFIPSSAP